MLYESSTIESSIMVANGLYSKLLEQVIDDDYKLLTESTRTGELYYLIEADTSKLIGKIADNFSQALDKLIEMFKSKTIGDSTKYKPWIDDIKRKDLKSLAKSQELNMVPFWDCNHDMVLGQLQTAANTAYGSTNYTDYSFAKTFLSVSGAEDIENTDLSAKLKNYFRIGKIVDTVKPSPIGGTVLASNVDKMCNYITSYRSVANSVESVSNAIKTKQSSMKIVEESITPDTYLSIVQETLGQTGLILFPEYQSVFEAVGGNTTSGEVRSQTNTLAKNAKESVTSVKKADESIKSEDTAGLKEKKTSAEAVKYKRSVDRFFKIAISSYTIARQEQFLAYVNALSIISGVQPKFDNDKYVKEVNKETK